MANRKYAEYLSELVESDIISPNEMLSALFEQFDDEAGYEAIIRKHDWIDPEDNIFEEDKKSYQQPKVVDNYSKIDQYKFMR